MKVSEFVRQYPLYAIDFAEEVRAQTRVYDGSVLDQFPVELEPDHPYRAGSRGRPNLNQTLTHSQCAKCHRVLRNDFFYTSPSMQRRNVVFSHCRVCTQEVNAGRYETRAEQIRARRLAVLQYLAPRCAICGFDKHSSAMDLHHPEHKEGQMAELITQATFSLDSSRIESLLREAKKSVPLCSNCHRMLHAGAIQLPTNPAKPTYSLAELLARLKDLE